LVLLAALENRLTARGDRTILSAIRAASNYPKVQPIGSRHFEFDKVLMMLKETTENVGNKEVGAVRKCCRIDVVWETNVVL
jgi:hypothetical protein